MKSSLTHLFGVKSYQSGTEMQSETKTKIQGQPDEAVSQLLHAIDDLQKENSMLRIQRDDYSRGLLKYEELQNKNGRTINRHTYTINHYVKLFWS